MGKLDRDWFDVEGQSVRLDERESEVRGQSISTSLSLFLKLVLLLCIKEASLLPQSSLRW